MTSYANGVIKHIQG